MNVLQFSLFVKNKKTQSVYFESFKELIGLFKMIIKKTKQFHKEFHQCIINQGGVTLRITFGFWGLILAIEHFILYNSLQRFGLKDEGSIFLIITIATTIIFGLTVIYVQLKKSYKK